jgi:hypothetical protein
MNMFERFLKYRVAARSVKDFLARYYRPERYTGRGVEYATSLLGKYQDEFKQDGFVFISCHDSVTGRVVAYYGAMKKVPSNFG